MQGLAARLGLLSAIGLAGVAMATRPALAGAWTEDEGRWLLVNQATFNQTSTGGYDQQGRSAGTGRYRQFEFSPYIEYGVTQDFTVGLQPRFDYVNLSYNTGRTGQSNGGLAEVNLFTRYTIYRWDFDVVSVQGMFGLPGVGASTQPQIAMPWAEYEARVLWGHAFDVTDEIGGFVDTSIAYRFSGGHAADQIHLDATIGIKPDPDWLIMAQGFATRSVRNQTGTGGDYDQIRVQLSVAHQIDDDVWLQLGGFRDVGGRKLARATGLLAALWFKF
jgi:hypothetical protein